MNSMITGLITVRSNSTRLPNKCFLKFGDEIVLEHVIKRTIHYGIDPIVCTTVEKSDNSIEELCNALDVKCFRGSIENKLHRWLMCSKEYGLQNFHTIDADDPFFCGDEMKRSMNLLGEKYNFIKPSKSSADGGAMVGYSITVDLLKNLMKEIPLDTDTEMMWGFFEKFDQTEEYTLTDPEQFNIKGRLTLDYWEDYIFLSILKLSLSSYPDRKDIYKFLCENPEIQNINIHRNDDWRMRQKNKLDKI
ncbi:hypothetical protein N9425_02605 [Gammaproteobacteria bacterium]|nr:hypothetical protein [Gammaproteobacteria bacterium]